MTNPRLSEVQKIQAAFDHENFSGAETYGSKRLHISLHLMKAAGKAALVEEKADHGDTETSLLKEEVIGDLIVFAAQYANELGVSLDDVYTKRLETVAERNGMGIASAHQALGIAE